MKKWKELTDSVTYCIAKDALPIYSVEKPGFKQMLKCFDSKYELPSRKYFLNTAIPELYTTVRERVRQEISAVDYYSATTDLWSSKGMRPYISYTVHFIDEDWQLKSRCLQTQYLPEDHNGEIIAEAMQLTLESWDLDEAKQVCLTMDSGSNIINAAERLDWPRLACFGYNLHLAVTKSVKGDHRCRQ